LFQLNMVLITPLWQCQKISLGFISANQTLWSILLILCKHDCILGQITASLDLLCDSESEDWKSVAVLVARPFLWKLLICCPFWMQITLAFMVSTFVKKSTSATNVGFFIFIVGFLTQVNLQTFWRCPPPFHTCRGGSLLTYFVVLCACLSTIMKEELAQTSWKHWIIKRGPPCQMGKFWSFLLCGSLLLSLASPTLRRFQSPSAICGPCFHQICLQRPSVIWGMPHQPNKTQVSSGRIAQDVLIGMTTVYWQW
jgi:hypothetical protein